MRYEKTKPFQYLIVAVVMALWVVLMVETHQAEAEEPQPQEIRYEEQIVQVLDAAAPDTSEEEPTPIYHDIAQTITPYERGLLAMVVYREARGEPSDGQAAVVEVVLNRVVSDRFPDNIEDVIYQKDPVQFSTASSLTTAPVTELACLTTAYDIVDEVLAETEPVLPSPYLFFNAGGTSSSDYVSIGAHYFH